METYKISKRIQKEVININKSKKFNRTHNYRTTYEDVVNENFP